MPQAGAALLQPGCGQQQPLESSIFCSSCVGSGREPLLYGAYTRCLCAGWLELTGACILGHGCQALIHLGPVLFHCFRTNWRAGILGIRTSRTAIRIQHSTSVSCTMTFQTCCRRNAVRECTLYRSGPVPTGVGTGVTENSS